MTPDAFTRPGLIADGFQGFATFAALRADGFAGVPAAGGAYVVLREDAGAPAFPPECRSLLRDLIYAWMRRSA